MKYEYRITAIPTAEGGYEAEEIIQPDGDVIDSLEEAAEELNKLRIALADAIRRPMGVVPDSACRNNLVTPIELEEAEKRRPRDSATRPDWYF